MYELMKQQHFLSSIIHDLPAPFSSEIFLHRCKIAGTSHARGAVLLLEEMEEGTPLLLLREPKNPYDEDAVLVMSLAGEKLGYLPRGENSIFARLLDGGKRLQAKLVSVDVKSEEYALVSMDIYLKD